MLLLVVFGTKLIRNSSGQLIRNGNNRLGLHRLKASK